MDNVDFCESVRDPESERASSGGSGAEKKLSGLRNEVPPPVGGRVLRETQVFFFWRLDGWGLGMFWL